MAVNAVVKNNFVSPSGRGFCKVVLAGPVKAFNTGLCVHTVQTAQITSLLNFAEANWTAQEGLG
jgi:hypothetical protein